MKSMISSCKFLRVCALSVPTEGDSSAGRALSPASVRSEPAWSTDWRWWWEYGGCYLLGITMAIMLLVMVIMMKMMMVLLVLTVVLIGWYSETQWMPRHQCDDKEMILVLRNNIRFLSSEFIHLLPEWLKRDNTWLTFLLKKDITRGKLQ